MFDFNRNLFEFLFGWSGQGGAFDALIVFLAKFLPYLLLAGFLAWAMYRPAWKMRWLILAEGTLSSILSWGIIAQFIRFIYESPRPFVALGFSPLVETSTNSFPSGHAAFFFAISFTAFRYNKKLGWWLMGLSLLSGIARIMAGVHWPADILGGMGIGILSAAAIHQLIKPQLNELVRGTEKTL